MQKLRVRVGQFLLKSILTFYETQFITIFCLFTSVGLGPARVGPRAFFKARACLGPGWPEAARAEFGSGFSRASPRSARPDLEPRHTSHPKWPTTLVYMRYRLILRIYRWFQICKPFLNWLRIFLEILYFLRHVKKMTLSETQKISPSCLLSNPDTFFS